MLEVDEFSKRGDAPALAILKDNARKKAVRQVVETQEELTRIHERVTRTIDAYELTEKLSGHQLDEKEVERIAEDFIREQATLEFVDDMTQLLVILSDPVAKRKYQQQVAVFIVGFENLCGRRAKLLAQLQEFFLQNGRSLDEQFDIEPPEFDIEDVGVKVREALDKAEKATERLATVSKDVIKALEMANPKETKKGKKKLEKALQQSHHDIMSLTEKLIRVQNDLEESEGKMSQMYKSMEMKQVEVERLKVQAENAKKAADTVKDLKTELAVKENDLQRAHKTMADLELSVAHLEDKQERDFERNKRVREENQKNKDMYEEKIRDQQQYIADIRTELKQHYDEQAKEMVGNHQRELTQIRDDHKVELNRMQKALDVARRKSEELKIELSDSSKRNSVAADSASKRSSLFSPENSDGGESSPRTLSLKSSAQAVRFLNKGRTLSDAGSGSENSDSSSTPVNKSSTPSQTSPAAEVTQEQTNKNQLGKILSRKGSKSERSKEKKSSRGTPEKLAKSKSFADKPQAVVEPFGTSMGGEGSSQKKQSVTTESMPAEVQITTSVEMVDIGTQSETDDLSDTETSVQGNIADRKPSSLQVVPEEEYEDGELESLSKEDLIEKLEDFKAKAQERQKKLELELAELKNKYVMNTNAMNKQNEEFQSNFQKEKEVMLSKIKEAELLKEQAEKEAEQAFLQLEEVLSEQEEEKKLKEKALQNRQEEQTMTGLSLYDRHEEQTMTSGSLFDKQEQETMTSKSLTSMREEETMTSMSIGRDHEQAADSKRQSVGSQSSRQSSAQLMPNTGAESEQVAGRELSPRDSGFDGAGSSLKFDSRPSSAAANVPKHESDESTTRETKPGMLSPPVERRPVMSARARRRLINTALSDHPVAQETLKTYDAVLQFSENMVQWLVKEGLREQANLVQSVKPVYLNKEDTMQIIESMPAIRNSIAQILSQLGSVLSSQHLAQSTAIETKSVGLSTSQETLQELSPRPEWRPKSLRKTEDLGEPGAMESHYVKLLKEYNDLAEGYERLQQHMEEETKFHQEQTSQNVAVMTDMQDTITQLRNQLAELRNARSASSGRTSSSIMFTRLDAERNGKILKRAVNERRLSDDSFSIIMEHMDNYVGLPAKRLAHIVRRYSHHRSMKDIEQSLKQSGNLDESMFSTLDKMEALQNKRAQRWGDKMDGYADERGRLAEELTACFESLEQGTGIFLIKPVYSMKGRPEVNPGYVVTQRQKPSPVPPKPSGPATPAPTPWLQLGKGPMSAGLYRDLTQSSIARAPSSIPTMAQLEDGTMKMRVSRPMDKVILMNSSVGVAWQASKSQALGTSSSAVKLNTPKILELDVNRMMIGQTDVSKPIIPLDDGEELAGAIVRSYVTVERPTGSKQIRKAKQHVPGTYPPNTIQDPRRPHSGPLVSHYSPLPPIHMPKLRQESRSGKSQDSDAVTHSEAGSPVARKIEDTRPSTQGTVNGRDAHLSLITPEILPVR